MMYNPYQWGGMMGHPGMPYNPYMMMGGQQQHPSGMVANNMNMPGGYAQSTAPAASDPGLGMKPFDSSKMKQGRMGHYGYSEGRELAGPPVGQLPAGVPQHHTISPMTQAQSRRGGSVAGGGAPSSSYYQGSSSMAAWGDQGVSPRARYDGAPSTRQIQADLDTPYPRSAANEPTSGWTRWGPDGSVVTKIDGRMGVNHPRLREGRV
ncbi:hypothetical protein CI109_105300 [Kwoniella shandongensis]|uniref:Uncharacterized protein n=1 Tax=Kwoniella shandongensis TaxID=1734106 RepID=A0AAJ8LLC8_9TREE